MADPALTVRPAPRGRFVADGTYVVTGGLGGFGLEVARWMVGQGARHLVLVSRRGADAPGADEVLAELGAGAEVRAFAADVGSEAEVDRVLREVRASMPPIRGVFHAAAVLDDRPVSEIDRASLERVLGPKARGAWHLHRLTQEDPIEAFVLFSSVSSWIGNAGQGNYVAANAFLDQLAAWRRHAGLPAVSIAWGVLGDTGLVARDARLGAHLDRMGIGAMTTPEALHALGEILDRVPEGPGVMEAAWDRLVARLDPRGGARRFAELVEAAGPDGGNGLAARWAVDPDGAAHELVGIVAGTVARILRVAEVDPAVPLRDLGLDSLLALEIAADLEGRLGIRIPAMTLASGPSVHQLVEALGKLLLGAAGGRDRDPDRVDAPAAPSSERTPEASMATVAAAAPPPGK